MWSIMACEESLMIQSRTVSQTRLHMLMTNVQQRNFYNERAHVDWCATPHCCEQRVDTLCTLQPVDMACLDLCTTMQRTHHKTNLCCFASVPVLVVANDRRTQAVSAVDTQLMLAA